MPTQKDVIDATARIEAGDSPLEIRRWFDSFKSAVHFYAYVRGKQFAHAGEKDVCFHCGQPADNRVAELVWAAPFEMISIVNVALLAAMFFSHFHARFQTKWITFSSFHRFCPQCWRRLHRSCAVKTNLLFVRAGILYLGSLAVLVAIFGIPLCLVDRGATSSDLVELLLLGVGGFSGIGVSLFVPILYRSTGIPESIRPIGPRPFALRSAFEMLPVTIPGPPMRVVHLPGYKRSAQGKAEWDLALAAIGLGLGTLFSFITAFGLAFDPITHNIGRYVLIGMLLLWAGFITIAVRRPSKRAGEYNEKMTRELRERLARGT